MRNSVWGRIGARRWWTVTVAAVAMAFVVGTAVDVTRLPGVSQWRVALSIVGPVVLLGAVDGNQSDIDQVIDAVEQLSTGEYDVTVPTGEEGPIGRLSAAVNELAATLRDRERELRETNERLNATIEASPEALIALDTDDRVTLWNPAAEEIFGWTRAEVLGEPLPTTDDLEGDHREIFERLLDGETLTGVETERRRKDGDLIDVSLSAAPIRDADGEIVGTMAAIQDITDRKQRERRVETTSARLEALFEHSPDMIDVLDTDGRIVDANRRFCEKVGYTKGELAGMRIWELDREFDADNVRSLFNDMAVGDRRKFEGEYQRRDGSAFPVEIHLIRLDLDDEARFVAISRDISDRKARQQELRETKRQLELALEGTNMGVWEWNPETNAVTWNKTLERLMGIEPGTFGGTVSDIRERIHPDDESYVDDRIEQALESGKLPQTEFRMRHEDGHWLWVEIRGQVVSDETGRKYVIGIHQDITDRKKRQQELRETKRQLELALEGTNTGIWELDLQTEDVDWNETLERLVGLEPGAFEGTYEAFQQRIHPDDVERVRAELDRAIEADEPLQTEFRLRHEQGGWVWVGARGQIVSDGNGDRRMVGINNDITDRKERERDLQRYKDYTDDILDAIDDVFYVLDEDGNHLRWNESLLETTGYTGSEIADLNALDLFGAEARDRIAGTIEEAFETGEARVEAPYLTKDGERIPYEFVGTTLEDLDGNRVLAGIGRDISERVETERQLSRLMENIPGLVYRVENERGWPTEFVSEGVRELTGYDAGALERGEVSWPDIYAPDADRDRIWAEVQTALDGDESYSVVYPIETADGERRWVKEQGRGVYGSDGEVEALEGVIIDITERIEYEQELERTSELLDQAQRIATVGGWELDATIEPPEITWTDELYRIHGLPTDADLTLDRALDQYHPEDRAHLRSQIERAIETGEGYDTEVRVVDEEGESRWVRALCEPVQAEGAVTKLRGSVQDITGQKERERALRSLHETTRELLATETHADVADLVVETASAVLDTSGVGVYLLDDETNHLDPTAFTAGFMELCGDAPSVAVGAEDALWDCFVTETPMLFEDTEERAGSVLFGPEVESGLLVPIGDHGVFVAVDTREAIDELTRQLAETLVATTEAAFDRLESEADLRERDAELEARNQRLRRQIQITDIIRRIDQSLIGADDREEIESTVCERLVEAEDIAFAWIGSIDASDTALQPRTWGGTDGAYLDAISLTMGADSPDPSITAAETEAPVVVENVVSALQREDWRKTALAHDFQSVVSVPLAIDEYFYGVLTVYADEPNAFGDLERTVFAELGENIANSITAVETRQALHTDTFVELTLAAEEADTLFARIAREADCSVEYEGLAAHSAAGTRLFLTTTGAEAAAVEGVLDDLVTVTDYRLIDESDTDCLFGVTVSGETLVAKLVRHGASPRSIAATETELTLVVDVPVSTDVREFVEMVQDSHPSVRLQSRRNVNRTARTKPDLVASLFDALTDRQREVMRTAYLAGFFEWPRRSTGEEVAEILDVSQPTVNRHLRVGQKRLLEQLFEGHNGEPATED